MKRRAKKRTGGLGVNPTKGVAKKSLPGPAKKKVYTLAELLRGVTKSNIHGEVDWGPPVGNEVW